MNKTFDIQIIEDIFVIDSDNIYEGELMQQCFDIVGVFVAAIDLNGNITLINRKGRELLGYRAKEILGKNFIESYITKEMQESTTQLFKEVITDKKTYPENTQYHLNTSGNRSRIIEAKNISIRNKDNHLIGILISGEDITQHVQNQRNLQNDLNLYRVLANNLPDINLFLFDNDFRFIITEGYEMQNFGLNSELLTGKTLSELPNETLQNRWQPLFKQAIGGKEVYTEYQLEKEYYLIWIIPLPAIQKKDATYLAITQNVTSDKHKEQQLENAKAQAEQANNTKSEFLARVSHEIRTPLNAILGFTEQLIQTDLTEQQTNYLKIIDKSSEHLLALINDILILSKIEARQINFDETPFRLQHTVDYVSKSLHVKAKEKDLHFTIHVDEKLNRVLLGDAFRLRQILINMLSNAIKFTNNGYVELKCFLMDETENSLKIRFDVSDSGIGIKPENMESVFQQFKQADPSITKKYGGTGLGLTICKNLIELQRGSLSVSSQLGVGTTFSFVIPYKKGNENDLVINKTGAIDPKRLKGKKILLVDDDSVNRLLGKTVLEKFNCHFDLALNGLNALEKLKEEKYDVVLLDIHMPDISGIEVAKHLREQLKDNTTKIIAVTAAVMKNDVKLYYQVGINDFLIKPYKEFNLFHKICEVLNLTYDGYSAPVEEIILKEELSENLINLTELKQMTGNNKDNQRMLVKNLIDNSKQCLLDFKTYTETKNWIAIGEAAHKLLPSYRHIQAQTTIPLLTKIKVNILQEKQYSDIPKLVQEITPKIQEIIDLLAFEEKNM